MKIFQRVLHAVTVVVTAVGVSIVGLVLWVHALARLVVGSEIQTNDWRVLSITVAVWVLAAVSLGLGVVAIVKKLNWRILSLGFLVVVGFLTYLRCDDAEKPPLADLGPRVTEADEGYRTVMWMSKDSPYSRLKDDRVLTDAAVLRLPADIKDWTEHVRKHREDILWAWDLDVINREWIDAVNAKPPAGIWPQKMNDPIIDFRPVRADGDVRMARAFLLAVEDQRDDAIQSILPFILAWQQIQRTGPCMVHGMIACVSLKRSYSTIAEILKMGEITPDTKVMLAKALRKAPTTTQIIRNAVLGEQEFVRGAFDVVSETCGLPKEDDDEEIGSAFAKKLSRAKVRLGYAFAFNRNLTEKVAVSRFWQACAMAEARQIVELDRFSKIKASPWRLKNTVGVNLLDLGTPAYAKAVENIWQMEDLRLELLKQLEKP